jgi:serine/threonine-protein kinase
MPVDRHPTARLNSTVILTQRFGERRESGTARAEHERTAADALKPGTRLGRYLIIRRVGGGGMGIVYRGQDTELNRPVALKVLPPHLCERADYLSRFRSEAQSQARMNSPHVVTLYTLKKENVGEILVLEYIDGQTLQQRIRGKGRLTPAETVEVFEQALTGVSHIHQMGVVHRDLKPSNIFLTRDGLVKITDFGISKLAEEENHEPQHAMVGTLLYIPPEQINGRHTDFRSDIYTLGISLYETVTGRLPFERRTDYALMHAHAQENPPPPGQFYRNVPRALERVILKAMAKEPERRFQSTDEFRTALLKLGLHERRGNRIAFAATPSWEESLVTELSDSIPEQRPAPVRAVKGLRVELGLAALACVLAVTLGLFPLSNERLQSPPVATADATAKPNAAKPKTVKPKKSAAPRAKPSTVKQARTPAPPPAPKQASSDSPPRAAKAQVSKSTRQPSPALAPTSNKKDKYDALKDAWGG